MRDRKERQRSHLVSPPPPAAAMAELSRLPPLLLSCLCVVFFNSPPPAVVFQSPPILFSSSLSLSLSLSIPPLHFNTHTSFRSLCFIFLRPLFLTLSYRLPSLPVASLISFSIPLSPSSSLIFPVFHFFLSSSLLLLLIPSIPCVCGAGTVRSLPRPASSVLLPPRSLQEDRNRMTSLVAPCCDFLLSSVMEHQQHSTSLYLFLCCHHPLGPAITGRSHPPGSSRLCGWRAVSTGLKGCPDRAGRVTGLSWPSNRTRAGPTPGE